MRNSLAVKGARENNLRNIDVEIPREKLVVITGISGSGKSSLAFDTIYAEGQRRFLESLSAYAKRFASQLKKPNVDFVFGLSPVISIEQKTVSKNPRSTIGTMTDIYDYLRLFFCTVGASHCPYCGLEVPIKTDVQMVEHLLSLPEGAVVEICAPVFKIYGEDYAYLLAEIRSKGYRRVRIDGTTYDISEEVELDEGATYEMEVIIDRSIIKRDIDKQLLASIQNGLRVGEGFLRFHLVNPELIQNDLASFHDEFACPEHGVAMGQLLPYYFSFNDGDSACATCMGLGTYLKVHPDLLVPDKERSIKGGAFIPEAFKYDKNSWSGRLMYSLARHHDFSLDTPFRELPPEVVRTLFYGSGGERRAPAERVALVLPDGATKGDRHVGQLFRFNGIINDIERRYVRRVN